MGPRAYGPAPTIRQQIVCFHNAPTSSADTRDEDDNDDDHDANDEDYANNDDKIMDLFRPLDVCLCSSFNGLQAKALITSLLSIPNDANRKVFPNKLDTASHLKTCFMEASKSDTNADRGVMSG